MHGGFDWAGIFSPLLKKGLDPLLKYYNNQTIKPNMMRTF